MGIMDFFGDHASHHKQVEEAGHKAQLSHEVIAGAAAYEAAKAYEKHTIKHGKPESHAKAKELMAGISGGYVDRIIESKGLDTLDREKVKHDANRHVEAGMGKFA